MQSLDPNRLQVECKGRNNIQTEGNEQARWCEITLIRKGGRPYPLKVKRKRDGVGSQNQNCKQRKDILVATRAEQTR